MRRCHKCGTEWVSDKKLPGVKEYCEKCSAYLHCCLNCRFYSPTAHNNCYIPTTDWVGDKAGLNFCDEFEFADTDLTGKSAEAVAKDKARDAVRDLFGDTASEPPKPSLSDLDKLFGG